jgi:beta-carotene hydroxylase
VTATADTLALERATRTQIRTLDVSFAWPTIVLTVALLAGYWVIVVAAATGAIALWLAVILNALLAYGAYTPLHEASHGNIGGKRLAWVNGIVGVAGASLLLHNFTMHRTTHLAHHAHLNDPARDADHWVAGRRWWSVLLRCATLVFAHYIMGLRLNGRRVVLTAMAENTIPLAALAAVGWFAGWQVMCFAMVLPALIGATLLGLLFDYAVHTPHTGSDRFGATRIFLFPSGAWQVCSWAWMGQNYHLIHHLYPWLPFYRYAAAANAAQSLFAARAAPVVQLLGGATLFPQTDRIDP